MDFSTKAMEEITTIVAEEIGKQIEVGEINQLEESRKWNTRSSQGNRRTHLW